MPEWSKKTSTELQQRKGHQSRKLTSTEKAPVTSAAAIPSVTEKVAGYQGVSDKLQANSKSRLAF